MTAYLASLLNQEDVEAFNRYRRAHPDIEIDIAGMDLSEKNLEGINFSGIDLRDVRCNGTRLCQSDLRNSRLPHQMEGACLAKAKLPEIDLATTDLSYVHLTCPGAAHIENLLDTYGDELMELLIVLLRLKLTIFAIELGQPVR